VWVAPVPQLITGDLDVWAKAANISPIRVPGYWLHKDGSSIAFGAPPMPGEKLVYAMHGGGYCERSAHPSDPTAEIARSLLQHCESVHRVFSIEYRLSTIPPDPPANPFPAALFDAIAGYNYLVKTIGFSPDNIVFVGDSAGGNLAHALTRYIVEHYGIPGLGLPAVPGALILLSPWVDIGQSHIVPGAVVIDHLDNEQAIFYANAFLGPHGKPAADLNRYVSPASLHPLMQVSFKGFPRTFIAVGGAELFLDQIETLKDRMVRDLGVGNGVNSKEGTGKVTYFEVPDGVHDYIPFTWHEPERTQTLIEIGKWMSSL
jgi:acetyl esterase/lipase